MESPARATVPVVENTKSESLKDGFPVALSVFHGKDFYRVFFDWRRLTAFEQSVKENVYTLSFKRENAVLMADLAKITTALPENLRRWTIQNKDGVSFVSITLPPMFSANAVQNGNVTELTLQHGKEVSVQEKNEKSSSVSLKSPVSSVPPVVREEKKKPETVAVDKPVEKTALPETKEETQQKEAVALKLLDSFSSEKEAFQTVDVSDPSGFRKKEQKAVKQSFPARQEGGYRIAMLSFPWPKMTAVASFRRHGYLWLIFDRKGDFNFDTERSIYHDIIHEIVEIPHSRATVFRLVTAPGYNPSFRREGLLWIVDLMYQPLRPKSSVDLVLQRKTPFGPRLFIPLSETPEVIPVIDPEVGDLMYVAPLFSLGKGMERPRSFVDASFLKTAQGIVIVPKSDEVTTFTSNAGIEIRGPKGGMRFSSEDILSFLAKTKVAKNPMKQILDIGVWSVTQKETFWDNASLLKKEAALADKKEKPLKRLILARHYFANGLYPETLGVLKNIVADSKDFEKTAPFVALRGAANFMMRRYDEAVADLSSPLLHKNSAANFWRAAVKAEMSKNPEAFLEPMKSNMGILQTYPKQIKTRLALAGLRSAVYKRDEFAVQNFLELAYGSDNTPAENAETDYYYALWQEYQGMYSEALGLMTKLADGTDFKFRAFGGLEKTRIEDRLNKNTPQERIKELEKLLYAWHDGEFEYTLMTRLVSAYEKEKDYPHVLYLLKDMQARYSNRPEVKNIPQLMEDIFQKLYLEADSNKRLSPIKAIAIYDEFRDLIPKGEKGVKIARHLSDRLTAIDLLDKAAQLLQEQLGERISDKEKGLVGTRLALVRLLNKEPEKAITALDLSNVSSLSPQMNVQRRYIRAKALKDLGKSKEAADLLEKDESYESHLLLAEIYWDAKQWDKAADTFRKLIKRPTPNVPLTEREARDVLDWATALRLAGRAKVLLRLRENFLPYMQNSPYAEPFDFITQPSQKGIMDYKTVAKEINMAERFNSFFKQHVDKLKTDTRLEKSSEEKKQPARE